MNNEEIKGLVKSHYDSTYVDTEALMKKLRPIIAMECEGIKREQINAVQTAIFTIGCIIMLFIGALVLFPDYIDLTNEIFEFIGVSLFIGVLSVLVFAIGREVLRNSTRGRAKLVQ